MRSITSADQVLTAIQQVKAKATAFCTNFFPVQAKLETWIEREELSSVTAPGAVFFFRKDRDFEHLYFCAADPATLEKELAAQPQISSSRVTADIIGAEAVIEPLNQILQKAGLKPYARLVRLSRSPQLSGSEAAPQAGSDPLPKGIHVTMADECDGGEIMKLIETGFNVYADQVPMLYELQAAIADRQIFMIKTEGKVAAALFFETQGFTSAIRYWIVGESFRAHHFGSSLIRHYFKSQEGVIRFILWVSAANQDALTKYEHYGYKPDGLVDQVMASGAIAQ